ncbi:ATP-binding protein [Candidatus Sumerlaeota bacterium]|nr:ATP-binding protein [Candidatus Sumerlaeota bacterium]
MQAHGSVLLDAEGSGIGALVVLNDVTRLIKLENVRREFVANVSHELKTPITSIKGFVETLLEGAIDHPDEARRFLGIVQTHADRLHAIIEDLLSLSRIELEAERNVIILEPGSIREVLQAAIEICQVHARAKGINITLNCPADLRARINAALLEQAVVNLIDNAVKYSGDGKDIQVEAEAATSETVIRVRDHGCGIDAEHLSRLFERFYRVDKARSRKAGGTGLGLAITKHIAQAHGGSVGVESVLGEGSIFSIRLPKV